MFFAHKKIVEKDRMQQWASLKRAGCCSSRLSFDSRHLFNVYSNGNGPIAAEVMEMPARTNSSKLVSGGLPNAQIPHCIDFPEVQAGEVSSRFEMMSFLDAYSAVAEGRLRLFKWVSDSATSEKNDLREQRRLNKFAERTFTSCHFFLGGVFSEDDQFVAVTFVNTDLSKGNDADWGDAPVQQVSTLVVMRTNANLDIVAVKTVPCHTNGPQWLSYQNEKFLVVASGNSSPDPPFFASPAFLSVYHLQFSVDPDDKEKNSETEDGPAFTMIAQALLPQYPTACVPFIRRPRHKHKTQNHKADVEECLIAVGTRRAVLGGRDSTWACYLPRDSASCRLYRFSWQSKNNRATLRLTRTLSPNVSVSSMLYIPHSDQWLVGHNASTEDHSQPVVWSRHELGQWVSPHTAARGSACKSSKKSDCKSSEPVFDTLCASHAVLSACGSFAVTSGSSLGENQDVVNIWKMSN